MKRQVTKVHFASDEEYFLFEEKSELRHELVNENLFEMSGVSAFHIDVVLAILVLLNKYLRS